MKTIEMLPGDSYEISPSGEVARLQLISPTQFVPRTRDSIGAWLNKSLVSITCGKRQVLAGSEREGFLADYHNEQLTRFGFYMNGRLHGYFLKIRYNSACADVMHMKNRKLVFYEKYRGGRSYHVDCGPQMVAFEQWVKNWIARIVEDSGRESSTDR